MNLEHLYTNYLDRNSNNSIQHELLDQAPQPQLLPFERGEMLNPYALSILETIEPFFQKSYRCFAEFPLQLACSKEEGIHLPIELWRFWVNSRLDIVVMKSTSCAEGN